MEAECGGAAEALRGRTLMHSSVHYSLEPGQTERLIAIARKHLKQDGTGHDWDHTERVWHEALNLGRELGGDCAVITAAALLHDIARPMETAERGRSDHAALGAVLAVEILQREAMGDEAFRNEVADCIRTHRFRSRTGEAPATLEAQIVYDADKLDSLGAIGLGRAFHFAGHSGARVHNRAGEALAGEAYGREDTALREYLVKLKQLPEQLLTAPGRTEALRRQRFMAEFFAELDHECGYDKD